MTYVHVLILMFAKWLVNGLWCFKEMYLKTLMDKKRLMVSLITELIKFLLKT